MTSHIQSRLPRDTRASLEPLRFSIMTFSPRDNIGVAERMTVVRGKTLFGFNIELDHEKRLNSRGWFSDTRASSYAPAERVGRHQPGQRR